MLIPKLNNTMSELITENSHEDHIDRRGFLQCMAWAGTGALFTVAGGILSSHMLAGRAGGEAAAGAGNVQLRADQRQPHRLSQAGESRCRRDLSRDDRAHQCAPAGAGFHPAHGRSDATLGPEGVRRSAADAAGLPHEAGLLRAGRTRRAERQRRGVSRALRQGNAGRRLVQLRPEGRPFHRPRQCPHGERGRPRRARPAAARLAAKGPRGARGEHAHRRLRAHPALDDLSAMGLGDRRLGARAGIAAARSVPSPC